MADAGIIVDWKSVMFGHMGSRDKSREGGLVNVMFYCVALSGSHLTRVTCCP